jgi:hypothetical protein
VSEHTNEVWTAIRQDHRWFHYPFAVHHSTSLNTQFVLLGPFLRQSQYSSLLQYVFICGLL